MMNKVALQRLPRIWVWVAIAIFGLLVTLCFEMWVEPVLAEVLSDKPPADHIAITGDSGKNHTCVLTAAGGVKCWGSNEYGQLGDGSTTDSAVPVDVSGLSSDVVAVSAGDEHTCALTAAGGVKCWGRNTYGRLGDGSTTDSAVPVDVRGLSGGVVAIATGAEHTCALTASGGVKCWGNNGVNIPRTPEDVDGLSGGVVAVSAGDEHTCALTASGGVKCWGSNFSGRLGDGTEEHRSTPVDVIGLSSDVIAISSGTQHNCALTSTGGVKCWGDNYNGQLGDGTTTDRFTPVDVGGLSGGVVDIVAGRTHTCVQTLADGAKCWGNNNYGQLGDGSTINSTVPVDVGGLPGRLAALAVGDSHTCALTASGGVKCWGQNNYGQLGDGSASDAIVVDVNGLSEGVIAIDSGYNHTCAITASRGVKCWGRNDRGQLGDGTRINRSTPVDVDGLTDGISAIAAGWYHTCALTEAGGVKCWGINQVDGTWPIVLETDHLTPVDVSGLPGDISAITAGTSHTCLLTETGGVKCWGENRDGELGDGTTTPRSTPVDVVGLPGDVMAISNSSARSTFALTTAGGVKGWGSNYYGALGDGTTDDRHTPVDVVGLSSGVTAIENGCVLMAAGGVKCWGYNASGEVGDGTTVNRYTPVDVIGLPDNVIGITVGGIHACALTAAGEVKCWGYNRDGELGNGSTTNSAVPVDVIGLSGDVIAISAGGLHTCVLTTSGGVKCWGADTFGQLGYLRGSTTPKAVIGLEGVEGPEHAGTVVQPESAYTEQHFPVTVTFTAEVYVNSYYSRKPDGMVFFRDGSTVIGAAPLDSSGVATMTTSSLVPGTHRITAQYTGSSDLVASIAEPLLITIPPDTPPVINGTSATTVAAESAYSFTPTASDADGDDLTFSITNTPAWASFDTTTGALTGIPTNEDVGTTADISICVSDGVLSACLPAFDLEVTYTNHTPTISGTPPTSAYTYRNYYFSLIASDPDGDSLTFSISNQPAWASFDTATGTLSGTPGKADAGTTTGITISVSDGEMSASLPPFDLTVTHTNHAPLISGTPTSMVAANSFYHFTPIASDLDGDSLTFSISNQPAWASFDTATGTLSGIPSSSDIGVSTNIVIEVSDGELSAGLPTFDLTVTDSDPTIIVVSSSADSGPGSLRQAILDSPPGSTILLLSDVNLQSSLVIDKDLIITAPDGVRFTIKPQAGVKTRLFHITAGNVELRNLSLENGTAEGSEGTTGAGTKTIIVTLYPYPVVVEMETTGGGGGSAGYGGAILSETGGTLIIHNVHFTNNVARGGRGGDGIQSSEFEWSGDSGGNGGGNIGESEYAGHGGSGVKYDQYVCLNPFNPFDPTTWPEPTLDDCKHFLWNTGGGGGGGGSGLGGAIFVARGTLRVYVSTFSNNAASGGDGGSHYTEYDPCDHLRTDGECSELDGTPDLATPGQGKGGAIFAVPGSVVRLAGVQHSGNSASSAGTGTACPGSDDSNYCGNVTVFPPEINCDGVTTGKDLSFCINWANSTQAPDTIRLGNNITLSEDLPAIFSDITIEGRGYYLSGNLTRNVFSVVRGGDLKLSQVTIQDGSAEYGGGIFNAGIVALTNSTLIGNVAQQGGGIYNMGTLTVTNSTLSGNTATSDGGGIFNNTGTVTVTSSTLSGNTATSGGGIWNSVGTVTVASSTLSGNAAISGGGIWNDLGTLTVTNSTLSGNTASGNGGGIYNEGYVIEGLSTEGILTVTSSTLSGNVASGEGGGIYNVGALLRFTGTLLAQNSNANCASFKTEGEIIEPMGFMADEGYNLSDDESCDFYAPGSGNNTPLNLGPLADNGGSTQTHALPQGSPAVDAGGDICPATDQRGEPRPQGTACDAGAYESPFANQPPVAADDSVLAQEDTPITFNVASNDSDADGNLDPTSATVTTEPTSGSVVNNGDGTFTYTPTAGYIGPDAFTYRIYDTKGLWDEASVNIEVTPVNDPPVAMDDGTTTPENRPVTIEVVANDSDPNDNLDPTSATVTTDPTSGSVASNGDGSFTYTPAPGFAGNDSFDYEICDTEGLCDDAAVTVEVVPLTVSDTTSLNKAIDIVNQQAAGQFTITFASDITLTTGTTTISLQPGVTLVMEGMGYSLDGDGSYRGFTIEDGEVEVRNLTITNCSSDYGGSIRSEGTLAITNSTLSGNTAMVNGAGIWNAGTLTITNSTLLGNTALGFGGGIYNTGILTVTRSTLAGNVATSGGGITNWSGGAVTITDSTLSDNSAESGVVLEDEPESGGQGGGILNTQYATLTIVGSTLSNNSANAYGGGISNRGAVKVTNSTLSGNRAHNYGGGGIHNWSDGTVAITNSTLSGNSAGRKGGGISNDTGTVTVTNSIIANSTAGGSCAGGVTDGGHNISDDATCGTFAQSDPLLGPLADNGGTTWTHALLKGSPARDAGGDVCPDTDQRGEPRPQGAACDIGAYEAVPIVGDPPVAADDSAITLENTPVTIDVAANDDDPDDNLDPTTTVLKTEPASGDIVNNGDGSFTYTPDPDYSGSDSFDYEICDTEGLCDTATVSIVIELLVPAQENNPPEAVDDSAATAQDTSVIIDVAANDGDVDGNLDPATATAVSEPGNGSAANNGDGTFTYMPDPGFTGSDSFDYEICDTEGLCDAATVSIVVEPPAPAPENSPPEAVDDSTTTEQDTAVTVDAAANDGDVDGNLDPATATAVSEPGNGSAANNGDGTFTYMPDSGFTGSDSFDYEICDTEGLCDTAVVSIEVTLTEPPAPIEAEPEISVSVSTSEVASGEPFTFTIDVFNPGSHALDNVLVNSRVPGKIKILGAESGDSVVTVNNKGVMARIAHLAAGQHVIITIDAKGELGRNKGDKEFCNKVVLTYLGGKKITEECCMLLKASELTGAAGGASSFPAWIAILAGAIVLLGLGAWGWWQQRKK